MEDSGELSQSTHGGHWKSMLCLPLEKGHTLCRVQLREGQLPQSLLSWQKLQARRLLAKTPPLPAGPEMCAGIRSEGGGV